MPGITEVLVDLTPLLASLRRLGYTHTDLEKVAKDLVPVLRQDIAQGFKQSADPDGTPWKPTKAGNPPLVQTGALARSVVVQAQGLRVIGESRSSGAAVHQRGATLGVPALVPRKAKALRWLGKGGQPVFATRTRAHRVRIPQRKYLGAGKRVQGTVQRMLDEVRRQAEEM